LFSFKPRKSSIYGFFAFLINLFTKEDFYFGLSTFILFAICFIYFILLKK